ncbi:hypothetical protein Goari_008552 [Gossypium aridum]|uniref:RNase H type-1 domain-containing protein n=1 Tax=Gossypium aridum TaxID=34290 RepID=A0A7J8XVZ6_GOSAI|nr:hypothetical protein [Gossypium aridum]
MGACTIRNDFIPDSFDAEARAAIHGLRFYGSSIGAIIADGKALFGFFQQCQFKFITRKGNQAAHYLAKHGFMLENDNNDDADYFRGGPVLLYASLIMDCLSLVVSSWSFSQLHFDDLQACC